MKTSRVQPSVSAPLDPVATLPGRPSGAIRSILSFLILAHFAALFVTVTAAGSHRFPAPRLMELVSVYLTRPYTQLLFINNPYRFYAPNPGPNNVFWFRLKYVYKDEKGNNVAEWRWLEMPIRSEFDNRMPYQRHLSVTLIFDNMALSLPTPSNPNQRMMSEEGKIVLCSYVRHVAKRHPLRLPDGTEVQPKAVQFFNVYHGILMPYMVREGWNTYDLRLYEPFFYGEFTADGYRIDSPLIMDGQEIWLIQDRSIADLAAQILQSDLYPVFRAEPTTDRAVLMERVGTPTPIRELVYRFPELANTDTTPDDLHLRIVKFVTSDPRKVSAKAKS